MCFWRHNIYIEGELWMQPKLGHSPQPEIAPSWGLMSSTSVVPDIPSALPKHQRWIQRVHWNLGFLHKAASWGSQDTDHLDTRRVVPSLITGPLTQYPPLGRYHDKDSGFFPTMSFLTKKCTDPVIYLKMGSSAVSFVVTDGFSVIKRSVRETIIRRWAYTMMLLYMSRLT